MDLYLACPQRSPIACCPPSMSSPLKWTLIPPPVLVTPTSLPKTDPPTHPLALCGGPYCAPFLQTVGGPTAGCRSWPPAGPPSPPSAQSVLWVPLVAPSSSPGRGGTVPRRSWGWGTAQSCCSALGELGDSVRFASMLLGPTSRGAWSCMRLWVSTGLGGGGKGGWGDSLSWLLPAGMHGGKPRQSRWCSAGVRIRGEWCGGQWGHGGCGGGMREGNGIIVVLMEAVGGPWEDPGGQWGLCGSDGTQTGPQVAAHCPALWEWPWLEYCCCCSASGSVPIASSLHGQVRSGAGMGCPPAPADPHCPMHPFGASPSHSAILSSPQTQCLPILHLPITAAQCWDHVPVPSSGHQPTVLEPPGSQVGVLVGQ